MLKNLSNIQKEYGLKLRWINGGGDENGTWDYRYLLEDEQGTRNEIINQDAVKFIESQTLPTFRDNIKGYRAYTELFAILGIAPSSPFRELLESKQMSGYRLAKMTGISQSLIAAFATKDKRPLSMSFENANKVAQALEMSLDQLYKALAK